jgi:hypothetical protein
MVVELMKQHPGNDTCSILSGPGVKFQWQQKLVSAYDLSISKGGQYHLSKSNCAHFLIDVSGIVRAISSSSSHTLQAGGFVFFPPQSDIEIDGNENAGCVLLENRLFKKKPAPAKDRRFHCFPPSHPGAADFPLTNIYCIKDIRTKTFRLFNNGLVVRCVFLAADDEVCAAVVEVCADPWSRENA